METTELNAASRCEIIRCDIAKLIGVLQSEVARRTGETWGTGAVLGEVRDELITVVVIASGRMTRANVEAAMGL